MAGRAMVLATGARSRHAVLSLTTKFRLPHEGMADMEYLSRCVSPYNSVAALVSSRQSPDTNSSSVLSGVC